jgi:hypothetical protein
MTARTALPCPKCSRTLEPVSWRDDAAGTCWRCKADFEFEAFPALTAGRARVAAAAAVVEADSVCFFHASNRAETVCEDCGRLVCPVCTIDFGGKKRCPTCVAATKDSGAEAVVKDRVLYDSQALGLVFIPIFIWPFTLLTAPVAIGFVIYGWKKPSSLVRGSSRTRLIVAAIIALLQIAAWTVGLTMLANRR